MPPVSYGVALATRVVLAALPGIVDDIVRGIIDADPDFTLVGDVHDLRDAERLVESSAADLLIIGDEAADALRQGEEMAAARPGVAVIGIEAKIGLATRWQSGQPVVFAANPTEPEFLALLRGVTPR
jgi:hypothetical protein